MAYLELMGMNNHTERVSIDSDSFTIGRHGHYKTPYYLNSISRLHCVIQQGSLRDLNSFSGTRLNGKDIGKDSKSLHDGDSIQIGGEGEPKVIFVYRD